MDDNFLKDRWFWLSFFAGGMVLSLTLWFGFGMDQSICAYVAWVWKAYHQPPYVGVWDLSFPGIFVIYRIPISLFGASIFSIRLFDFMVQLSCLVMLFQLTKKLSGSSPAAFFAALFYSLFYFGLGQTDTAQRESFIFWLLLICTTAAFSMQNRVLMRAAIVGLLAGFCFLIKPFYGLCWPVFGILLLVQGLGKKSKSVWPDLFLFGICCILPSLAVVFHYWRLGHLTDLYQQTLWFNFAIYGKGREQAYGLATLLAYIIRHNFLRRPWLIVLGDAGVLVLLFSKTRRKSPQFFWVMVAMLVMGIVIYLLQYKFFPFHLFVFLGFSCMFAGIGLAFLGEKLRTRAAAWPVYSVAVMTAIFFLGPGSLTFARDYGFGNFDAAYRLGSGFPEDSHHSSDQFMAAEFLKPLLKPGDEIEFFGPFPLLQFLLRQKPVSPYVCVQHFLFTPPDGQTTPEQKQWMKQYSDAVISHHPRFFLVTDNFPGAKNKFINLKRRSLRQTLELDFPELKNFLDQNYRLTATVRSIDVYELAK
jgi:hypothetical protein